MAANDVAPTRLAAAEQAANTFVDQLPSTVRVGVVGTGVGFIIGVIVCAYIEDIRRFLSWLTNTELFSPELYFLSQLPAHMNVKETTAVVSWRSACRCWRRSIRHGARPGSIRSKRCAMNDRAQWMTPPR